MATELDAAPVVWISLSELASKRSVSVSAIAQRVEKLEAEGLVTTRKNGRRREVDEAAFERAVSDTGDAAKEIAAETKHGSTGTSPEYRDAQTRRAQIDARMRMLDYGERQKKLLPIEGEHGLENAASQCGVALAREIDGISRYAEELATAANKDGVTGTRRVLKTISRNLREAMAKALNGLAAQGQAAEQDGMIETTLSEDVE